MKHMNEFHTDWYSIFLNNKILEKKGKRKTEEELPPTVFFASHCRKQQYDLITSDKTELNEIFKGMTMHQISPYTLKSKHRNSSLPSHVPR